MRWTAPRVYASCWNPFLRNHPCFFDASVFSGSCLLFSASGSFSGSGCCFLLSVFLPVAFCFCYIFVLSAFCFLLCAFCFLLFACCFLLVAFCCLLFCFLIFAGCVLLPVFCFLFLAAYGLLPAFCFLLCASSVLLLISSCLLTTLAASTSLLLASSFPLLVCYFWPFGGSTSRVPELLPSRMPFETPHTLLKAASSGKVLWEMGVRAPRPPNTG